MRSMKGAEEGIYVYRFYPAEVCTRLVWNDAGNLTCADDWAAGFVRSRNARGRIRFYVKWTRQEQVRRQSALLSGARSSPSSCWDGLSPTRLLVLQARRGTPGEGAGSAAAPSGGEEEAGSNYSYYEVVPASETRSYGQMSAAVLAHVRASLAEGTDVAEPQQPPPARPLLFGERPDRAVEMAQRTEDVARSARESGTRNGMNIILVIALEKIEEGLAKVRAALQENSLHGLWLAIRDLRGAIDEYAWATSVVGRDPEFMERVRSLSSIVAGMQHNLEFSLMQLSAPPFYADV
jgi:hypothetical protein